MEYHVNRGIVLAIAVERRVAAGASMDDGVGHAGASQAVAFLSPGRIRKIEEGFVSRIPDRENLIDMLSAHGLAKHWRAPQDPRPGPVADRTSVVSGKGVSFCVALGGPLFLK